MEDKLKITTTYYKKYIGSYAKRFYTPFLKENIFKIVGFKLKNKFAYFIIEDENLSWEWDIEDCVIITDEIPIIEDSRIANIHHPEYKGYNPFS